MKSIDKKLMELVRLKSTRIDKTLSTFGSKKVMHYLKEVISGPFPIPLQDREDLLEAIYQQTEHLMGTKTASQVVEDIRACPIVSTVNHMGVDFTAQTLQGNLLLAIMTRDQPTATIPILSCANIPLNNYTFPRGALFYKVPQDKIETLPVKLPLFPKKFNTCMVQTTPRFTQEMVHKASERFQALIREKKISPDLAAPGKILGQKCYTNPAIMALNNYPDQACLANKILFENLFKKECRPPELVFINMEKIVMTLLKKDLRTPQSIAHDLFFTPTLLEQLLTNLSGFRGCWDTTRLAQRSRADYKDIEPGEKSRLKACGTMLFWGVNEKKQRVPLSLIKEGLHGLKLQGKDENGRQFQVDFTQETLIHAMDQGTLVPSNFTCFLVLVFARAIVCIGGYYQSEYLPTIRDQVSYVLLKSGDKRLAASAKAIGRVPCDRFFSAMAGVMCSSGADRLFPAGGLEILSAPLSMKDIAKIQKLTVEQAFYAALLDTVMNIIPGNLLEKNWKGSLSLELCKRLKDKVVIV